MVHTIKGFTEVAEDGHGVLLFFECSRNMVNKMNHRVHRGMFSAETVLHIGE